MGREPTCHGTLIVVVVLLLVGSNLISCLQYSDIPVYTWRILNEFHHDPQAFTQGLIAEGDFFYEGTGLYGRSSLRRVEIATGDIQRLINLPNQYFGEGITSWGNTLIQITWREHIGFVYDKQTFEQLDTFVLHTEGWGLTHNGTHLIVSDGSSNLYFLDPNSFSQVRVLQVTQDGAPVRNLNELEFVNGNILANIWFLTTIVIIDPSTGHVVGKIELVGLYPITDQNVLNGIAFDNQTNGLYVTGKLWSKVFQIELSPPLVPPLPPLPLVPTGPVPNQETLVWNGVFYVTTVINILVLFFAILSFAWTRLSHRFRTQTHVF